MSAWKKPNSGRNWCSMMRAWRSLPPVAASSTGRVDQRVLAHEVEQVLEQSREGCPVHRAGDDQHIGALNPQQLVLHGGRKVVAAQRSGELGADGVHLDQMRADRQLPAEGGKDFVHQGGRLRRSVQAPGHSDDLQRLSSSGSDMVRR